MTDHEQYELLCTLASTRQLTIEERGIFEKHLQHCRACRDQLYDLTVINMRLRFDAALYPMPASMPAGSVERFRIRAIQEGCLPRRAERQPTPWALASVCALLIILSSLIVMPRSRKAPESFSVSAGASSVQPLSASADPSTHLPRPLKLPHALGGRHHVLRHVDTQADDTSPAAQRFLQAIPSRYPFFAAQIAIKSSRTIYPALSSSQISDLDLFRGFGDAQDQNLEGITSPRRPINMASTANVFDFAVNIRQLHFQLPTAQ